MNTKTLPPGRRAYGQACNIALTLDVVGERWTLLIVRELLTGSTTFSDLQDSLPGLAPNLLSTRLKQLEQAKIVEQERAPGMRRRLVYALTEHGRALEPLLVEMVRFGNSVGLSSEADAFSRPGWSVLSAKAVFRKGRGAGLSETYEFRVGNEVFYLGVRDGEPNHGVGHAAEPAVVAAMSPEVFNRWQVNEINASDGIKSGQIRIITGHSAALERCEFIYSS